MTSSIEDLLFGDVEEEHKTVEFVLDKVNRQIVDFEIKDEDRMKLLEWFHKEKGDEVIEQIKRLIDLYSICNITSLKKFLHMITLNPNIVLHLRLELAKVMSELDDEGEGPKNLDFVVNICVNGDVNNKVITPLKVGGIFQLMKFEKFDGSSLPYFLVIINDTNLDSEYRYKLILSLPKQSFKIKAFQAYMTNDANSIAYRILAAQNLMTLPNDNRLEAENLIYDMLQSLLGDDQHYNHTADLADILLRYGSVDMKVKARHILEDLSSVDGIKPKHVFQDAQNAHNQSIEDSAIQSLIFLKAEVNEHPYESNLDTDEEYTFEKVYTWITWSIRVNRSESDKKAIKAALNRIGLDSALYSHLNISLSSALVLLYKFIMRKGNEHTSEMLQRLYDELIVFWYMFHWHFGKIDECLVWIR